MMLEAARESLRQVAERHGLPRVRRELAEDLRELAGAELLHCEATLGELCGGGGLAAQCARHLVMAGGKRVRPLLCVLAGRALGGGDGRASPERGVSGGAAPRSVADLSALAAVAEAIHAATLLHDDVLDQGETRRGSVTARIIYGNSASVLGGDLLLVRALERLDRAGIPGLLPSMLATLARMIDAEARQLEQRGRVPRSTDTYFAIVDGKTASLFEWALEAGARAGGGRSHHVAAARRYGGHVGTAFQILDDLMDLPRVADDGGGPAGSGKDLLQDVRQGTVTLPVLLAVQAEPALAERLQSAASGSSDPDLGRDVVDAVLRCEADSQCRARVRSRTEAAVEALEGLPPSPAREALRLIAEALAERAR
jgi:octaprenyl-diphosphate synthase